MARIDSDDWQVCIHLAHQVQTFGRLQKIYIYKSCFIIQKIYSFFPISKKGLFCQFSFFTLRHVPQRGKPYKSPFCSCSRRFNGADVRTVHSRKFICWVHCVRSLIGIIILLHQLHLLYLIFQDWFLYSTLIIVVFLNVCTAIFQGGIIGKKGTDTYLIDLYVLLTSVSDPYHLVGSGSVSGNVDMDPGSAKN